MVEAKFQRMPEVVIMEDFPHNETGKTLKREMREPHWKGKDKKL
jgi:hypothetical protein